MREEDDFEVIVSGDLSDTARRAVRQSNKLRAQKGLGSLDRTESLDNAASYFARYLARTGKFGHQADESRPTGRAQEFAYIALSQSGLLG